MLEQLVILIQIDSLQYNKKNNVDCQTAETYFFSAASRRILSLWI